MRLQSVVNHEVFNRYGLLADFDATKAAYGMAITHDRVRFPSVKYRSHHASQFTQELCFRERLQFAGGGNLAVELAQLSGAQIRRRSAPQVVLGENHHWIAPWFGVTGLRFVARHEAMKDVECLANRVMFIFCHIAITTRHVSKRPS